MEIILRAGDRVTYDSCEHGPTPAEIIEVYPGGVHVEPQYRLRLETNGEVLVSRADWVRPILDFPAAWAIQKEVGPTLDHHPRCSSVPGWSPISGPGLLCDCGAVGREWKRRLTLPTAAAPSGSSPPPA